MDDLLDLPSSVNGWNSEIASRQLTGKSILDLRSYDSGSKIKQEQFLLLRAYYVVLKRDEFSSHHRARWFPYYDKAKDILNSEEAAGLGWQQYLDSFDDPAFKKPLPKFPNLGSFSLVRYYQRAVENVNSSHVSQKTRYFTRSVSKSSETRREELQTPIRSSSRHLPADLNERMGDLTLNTPGSTMSPYDASDATEMAKLLVPTEDEQIVNTALIIFLTTITMHFTNKVHWSLERKAFQVCAGMDKMFEARVDGILRSGNGENDDVLAIMEVKPCMRLLNRVNIRMQETAQMACWISSQSDSSLLSQTSGKYGRHKRLLISQDRHEIWLTLAEFDDPYIQYIHQGTIPKGGADHESQAFLKMEELGPFETRSAKYMENLGRYILAFVLEQCHGNEE